MKDKKATAVELRAAREQLNRVYEQEKATAKREKRRMEETPDYWAANDRVLEAERHVSWWRR